MALQRATGRGLPDAPGLGDTSFKADFTFVQMADTQLGGLSNRGCVCARAWCTRTSPTLFDPVSPLSTSTIAMAGWTGSEEGRHSWVAGCRVDAWRLWHTLRRCLLMASMACDLRWCLGVRVHMLGLIPHLSPCTHAVSGPQSAVVDWSLTAACVVGWPQVARISS
jgi:hypothetical protein